MISIISVQGEETLLAKSTQLPLKDLRKPVRICQRENCAFRVTTVLLWIPLLGLH